MKVLIALQNESFENQLLSFVTSHSWNDNAEFLLLHAVEPSDVLDAIASLYGQNEQKEVMEYRVKSAQEVLSKCQSRLQNKMRDTQTVQTKVLIADPKRAIVSAATDWNADVIIIGSHGRSGLEKMILGSVSLSVLQNSPCDVVLVHPHKER